MSVSKLLNTFLYLEKKEEKNEATLELQALAEGVSNTVQSKG